MPSAQRIPVNVLTGFLGSGKTTLLRRLLASPALADCAVLINEFGDIGLDHQLLERIDQEMVLLKSGCICCNIRDDLRQSLADLFDRREKGRIPPFTRVIIETSGLADPMPVLNTIMIDPVLRHHFRVGNVIATLDAVNGSLQLQQHEQSRRQIAVADSLIVTKADLVAPDRIAALRDELQGINASARLLISHDDVDNAALMLEQDIEQAGAGGNIGRWFPLTPGRTADRAYAPFERSLTGGQQHIADIATVSLYLERPIDWIAFGVWLSMLLHSHGDKILRVKGILNIQGSPFPVVVHGVQHLIHPPTHLAAWPDDDRRSRLVLIGTLPPLEQIRDSLEAFCGGLT